MPSGFIESLAVDHKPLCAQLLGGSMDPMWCPCDAVLHCYTQAYTPGSTEWSWVKASLGHVGFHQFANLLLPAGRGL